MAFGSRRRLPPARTRRHRRPTFTLALATSALAVAAAVALVLTVGSRVTLSGDPTALARLSLPPFAGTLERAAAFAPDGKRIPLAIDAGRLTPLEPLSPGERVSIEVVVKRPGWLSWALGSERREVLTLSAPRAQVTSQWLTLEAKQPLRVHFANPVSAVAYGSPGQALAAHPLHGDHQTLTLPHTTATGTLELAVAARTWERLAPPVLISWFAPSSGPQLIASPAVGTPIKPLAPLTLTYSRPLATLNGSALPTLTPTLSGHWQETDSHTLTFTPAGVGLPLGATVAVTLPQAVAVAQTTPTATSQSSPTRTLTWTVATPSPLALQELLAQQHYLPLSWAPSAPGPSVNAGSVSTTVTTTKPTAVSLINAVTNPKPGSFAWRFPHTPASLTALWTPGKANVITRGAVMTFERLHGLAVDGVAGPAVWRALLNDALHGRRDHGAYNYVYVRRQLPQLLTLWSDGRTVLTSPGNTGIPQSPTKLGTFTVFEHLPSGTMSGTNPDGSHYDDPGVRYISYFNGGDALHAFPRASYGTPQSLGCVELPLPAAAQLWPYTPLGTLVTIEQG